MKEAKYEYECLCTQKNVLVRIPKESGFMTRKPGFVAFDGQKVPAHWHNGKPLTNGLFLNVFFYDLPESRLGKKIVATVKVMRKILPNGDQYTFLDVWCTPDEAPIYELKLPQDDIRGDDVLRILHSNQRVEFRDF